MKTTRTNCFETNSSSTHSFTVNAPYRLDLKPSATFLPGESGKIEVQILGSVDFESCLYDKLNFVLAFAYLTGDKEGYDRVIRVVESFTNLPVDVTARKYEAGAGYKTYQVTEVPVYETEEAMHEAVEDTFYSYVRDYGHGSVENFLEEGRKVIASDQSVLVFIFTNHRGFSRETHYDG